MIRAGSSGVVTWTKTMLGIHATSAVLKRIALIFSIYTRKTVRESNLLISRDWLENLGGELADLGPMLSLCENTLTPSRLP